MSGVAHNAGIVDRFTCKAKARNIGTQILLGPLFGLALVAMVSYFNTHIKPVIDDFRPVVTNITHKQLVANDKIIIMQVFAEKQLPCYYVPDSQQGEVYADGHWQEADFEFLEDNSRNSTRPLTGKGERASFGKWEWSGDMAKVKSTRASMNHICEPQYSEVLLEGKLVQTISGRMRETTIGPFSVVQSDYTHHFDRGNN